jgi:hypothetical protein
MLIIEINVTNNGHVAGNYGKICLAVAIVALYISNVMNLCIYNKYMKNDS